MCIAELQVSVLDCRHRWYHLAQSCEAGRNLSNCAEKIKLQGWEQKVDFCPFCSRWNYDNCEYRLFGNDRTPSIGGLSRNSSFSTRDSLTAQRRDSRRGSLARTDSSTSITLAAGSKNRAQNMRIDAYLSTSPDKLLKTDSYREEDEDEEVSPPESSASSTVAPLEEKASAFSKGWRKSKRLTKGFFT